MRVLNRDYKEIPLTWIRSDHFYGVLKQFSVVVNDTHSDTLAKQLRNETFYYSLQSLKPNTLYEMHFEAQTESITLDPSIKLYVRMTMKPGNLVTTSMLFANGTKYSRMIQVKFWKTAFKKFEVIWFNLKTVFRRFYLVYP